MSWWETLAAPFRRLPAEVLAAIVVLAAVFVLSWANRDLHDGLGAVVQQYPNGMHGAAVPSGTNAPVRDATDQMMAQVSQLMGRLNVETNHVTALQLADTVSALLAVVGTQRPDLLPQTKPVLDSVQLKRSQLAAHVMSAANASPYA